ncbi:nucleoside phosphorylase domain-containing protein [Aspergillus avenaceus]|uniref:Nucleoside phosphorylase domain-containing protein n=1 Tax=Aspergillus avenaceus TaxID=36643 RepID=A0A5N6U4W9_ASPAV|nr:nucleoside phosphorylase domain-containing protein [Aspergillus avenaceus]
MPNDFDFTVGWICTLLKDYVAAIEFLEEIYDDAAAAVVEGGGQVYYTRGRIGGHNVVIGCLPTGHYGLVSTSGVADDMKARFPSIKLGFLVGIGGGAPSPKNDIRLGDVVIGTKIIQYGFGRKVNAAFKVTGHTFSPSPLLLHAVTGLKTRVLDGLDIAARLEDMADTSHQPRETFNRPNPDTDRLYQSGYTHGDGCDCTRDTVGNSTYLINRPSRMRHQIIVHDGVIASADQVVKDAITRDQFTRELDALCFDTEVAGLSDSFSWIAIRGICDYCDSHKNERWHDYAAATAAACAKELLLTIPGDDRRRSIVDEQAVTHSIATLAAEGRRAVGSLVKLMQNSLIGICVLVAGLAQIMSALSSWMLSITTEILSPETMSPKSQMAESLPVRETNDAPIHISIYLDSRQASRFSMDADSRWIDLQQEGSTKPSRIPMGINNSDKIREATTELLKEVNSLMDEEPPMELNPEYCIRDAQSRGRLYSLAESSCDPLDTTACTSPSPEIQGSRSPVIPVSNPPKPPVPPRAKKPREFAAARRTQSLVPKLAANKPENRPSNSPGTAKADSTTDHARMNGNRASL